MGDSEKRGSFVVVSSPSGGGKTSVIERFLELNPDFAYSVSATTRLPRNGEVHGQDYYFLRREEFLQMRDRGELLEWEEVYGDFYGTPRKFAEEAVAHGQDVIFDLDVKGALHFKEMYPHTILVFISPPSLRILEERLRLRSTETETALRNRLKMVEYECSQAGRFDFNIINDDLEQTVSNLQKILESHNVGD